ncbi:MAG: hypothetical protein J6T60_08490 [Bacteroidales bacterium]|nr:hypothetical protein [Bacteroidales bacterium]
MAAPIDAHRSRHRPKKAVFFCSDLPQAARLFAPAPLRVDALPFGVVSLRLHSAPPLRSTCEQFAEATRTTKKISQFNPFFPSL